MHNSQREAIDQAWACLEKNDFGAIDQLLKNFSPNNPSVKNIRAVMMIRQGRFQDAIEILRYVVLPRDGAYLNELIDPAIRANFVLALLLNGNDEGFLSFIDQLPKDNPACGALHAVHETWLHARNKRGWLKRTFGATPPPVVPSDLPRGWRDNITELPPSKVEQQQSLSVLSITSEPSSTQSTANSTNRTSADSERKSSPKINVASPENRQIRVFISSTFRDMMRERDLLVKQVFPALRSICAKRFVTFTEVDLRWGITEEQAAEGKVLPLCLAEIERSRPYFIGLLGERYGWIPDAIPAQVIEREPWLKEHLYGRTSVTELEILHGVLNNPEMQGHSFFYFRDPSYAENPELPDDERLEFVEREIPAEIEKYGQEEAARRTIERKEKLATLKQRIRESQLPLVETFANPEELAAIIEKQFEELINRLYPEPEVPDPLDRERMAHEAHARNKLFACIDRPSHLAALTAFADQPEHDGKGIVVTGESGSGKTALLAAWSRDRTKTHPEEFLFQHYFGATPDSSSPDGFLRRLLGELKSRFGITEEIPSQPDKLREALPLWLAQTVNKGRIILILDGLNQVQGSDPDKRLGFLPRYFPPNIVVLASAIARPALDILREREWTEHELPLATREEVDAMVGEYFRMIGRLVDEKGVPLQTELRSQIVNAPGSKNPLILRTVLEELRQFGSFEKLPDQVRHYLQAQDPKELFLRVIRRWQADFDNGIDLVRRALTHLWAAREGLSESELLDLLGSSGNPLPRAHWTPLFLALEPHLSQRSGLFAYSHDFIRQSVENEFLTTTDEEKDAHLALADYFEKHPNQVEMNFRKAAEWPWQLLAGDAWKRLVACLTHIPLFLALYNDETKWQLTGYWHPLRHKGLDMGDCYSVVLKQWSESKSIGTDFNTPFKIGMFLLDNGLFMSAEPILYNALDRCEMIEGSDGEDTLQFLNGLALCKQARGEYREAKKLYERLRDLTERLYGYEDRRTLTTINNLATAVINLGDYASALKLLEKIQDIQERVLGPEDFDTLRSNNHIAVIKEGLGDLKEAQMLLERTVDIFRRLFGNDDPNTVIAINNLAHVLLSKENYVEALPLFEETMEATNRVLGPEHPKTLISQGNLAKLFKQTKRYDEAQNLYQLTIDISKRVLGPEHPDTLTALNNLAMLLVAKGNNTDAQELFEKILEIREHNQGAENPQTVVSLINLAGFFDDKDDFMAAAPLFLRALDLSEKVFGAKNERTLECVKNLGRIAFSLGKSGDYVTSRTIYETVLEFRERVFGEGHHETLMSMSNLAELLYTQGNYKEASTLFERTLNAVLEISLDQDGPHDELQRYLDNYIGCLEKLGCTEEQILAILKKMAPEVFSD